MLILRFAFSKGETGPNHLLDDGVIWYDQYNNGQPFFDYTLFNNETEWFKYCTDREYGPDRTIIALAPSGDSMISEIKSTIESDLAAINITQLSVVEYSSRDAIFDLLKSSSYEKNGQPGICFGAAFTKNETNDYQVNMIFDDILTERTIDPNMPNQELDAVDRYQRGPNEEAFTQYKEGGYMYLQNLFANALLRNQATGGTPYISMIYTPSKTSRYNDDDFQEAADQMWNFIILLIYLAPLYRFTYNSVNEKETKIREAMKIMGLTDAPYWLSWFTYYTAINTLQSLVMLILLLPVFEYSNKLLVFLYLWIYGMSLFGFGLFVGAFFSSGKTAAISGTMLFYLTSFLTEAVADRTISESVKNFCSIFPAVAVQLAGSNLLEFEGSGIGLNFDNASEEYLNYRFETCLYMMTISFFIFATLGLYLENVLPGAVGVRKPFYYPFTKQYWCDIKKKPKEENEEDEQRSSNRIANSVDEDTQINPENFEEIPEYLQRKGDDNESIHIKNLKKRFGNFLAINGLNGEMYEDQIFALLGHNGAGKTTTINALCGMIAPSRGDATIYGYNIKTEMKNIRKIMGICPQHNVLFPKLTVQEHLMIFAAFKGMDSKEAKIEREQLMKDLNLSSKRNVLSKDLSGGYKRKLSLGIAL